MRTLMTAGLIAGLALAAPISAQETAEETAPETAATGSDYDASTVLATVNGTEITLGHVVVMRKRLPDQYQQLPDPALLNIILEQLVDQTLLAESLSSDPANDPLEVRLHLENERRGNLALNALNAQIGSSIEPAEVQKAYDEAFADFEPSTEYSASHILVETEERARELLAEIEAGGDFAALAAENSGDPGSAQNGGDLGWFGAGVMVPEFEAAVTSREPGAVGGPIETQFGWHLIRLNETRESSPPPLDTVRPQIEDQLRQAALQSRLESLRASAQIELLEGAAVPGAIRDESILVE